MEQSRELASSEAAHEFGALNTLLLCVILGLCVLCAYLIKQNSFYYLPESGAAIVVGMVVGGLARVVFPSTEELAFLSFEPELFFFLLLPPIIFEAGYSLEKGAFFANFWTILVFAVFGTIISTFTIGLLVYVVGLIGLVDIDTSSPMEALVFGALISAVDPVATLSIMGNPELNCDPLLYALVFGESVLNDAVAIVLFKTFLASYESEQSFSSDTIPLILKNFTLVSLGSVAVGVFIALACSYLCKNTQMRLYPEYEISMLFLFAYGSYSFSEALGLSGIMSLFFCALVLSHYNSHNLSPTSQITAHNIFKSLAVLSEYFVFLYIGMGLFTGKYTQINIFFTFLCTGFCLLARVFNIFPLAWVANLGRKVPIPYKMQVVMWFAGLRGAIAFALSQNMPGEHKDVYVSTTLGIVIFTCIVCGGLTEPILKKMGMRMGGQGQGQGQITGGVGVGGTGGTGGAGGAGAGGSGGAMVIMDVLGDGTSPPLTPTRGGGVGGGVGGGAEALSMSDVLAEVSGGLSGVQRSASKAFFGLMGRVGGHSYGHLPTTEGEGRDLERVDGGRFTGGNGGAQGQAQGRGGQGGVQRSFIQRFDAQYMQPVFGGPAHRHSSHTNHSNHSSGHSNHSSSSLGDLGLGAHAHGHGGGGHGGGQDPSQSSLQSLLAQEASRKASDVADAVERDLLGNISMGNLGTGGGGKEKLGEPSVGGVGGAVGAGVSAKRDASEILSHRRTGGQTDR